MNTGIQKEIFKKKDINSAKKAILKYYHDFENCISISYLNTTRENTPVNFKLAKKYPRHRWYTYKEGFSPVFVKNFIDRFKKGTKDVVFDPFGGIGTTALQSALQRHKSYSNDINELSNYIARVKSDSYSNSDISDVKKAIQDFKSNQLIKTALPPNFQTVVNYFEDDVLKNILRVQAWIDDLHSSKTRNLFNLSLITNLELFSTHRKDGNGLKKKTKYSPPTNLSDVKKVLLNNLELFIKDIETTEIIGETNILSQSSFEEYKLPEKADLVITSPPYANCFDYSKVYLVELWFSRIFSTKNDQKAFRESSIISHVHYSWDERHDKFGHSLVENEITEYLINVKLWDKKIPAMLRGYFSDMGKVLKELTYNLNDGAVIGMVVGNSVYAGLPIATDILIAEMAKEIGYDIDGIEIYRQLNSSPQQMKKLSQHEKKYLRESLILLKWK